MNREPEHGLNEQLDTQLDAQITSLTRALRDTGIPPERDLWPEIDQAIAQADRIQSVPSGHLAGWRVIALAASVLLLVGVGLVQHGGLPGRSADYQANKAMGEVAVPLAHADFSASEVGGDDPAADMQVIDRALADLNQALADDPDNGSLSRLVLMIHKSRGNMIRNTVRRLADGGR